MGWIDARRDAGPALILVGLILCVAASLLIGNPFPVVGFVAAATPGLVLFIEGCRRWGWGWWRV